LTFNGYPGSAAAVCERPRGAIYESRADVGCSTPSNGYPSRTNRLDAGNLLGYALTATGTWSGVVSFSGPNHSQTTPVVPVDDDDFMVGLVRSGDVVFDDALGSM
jgi:hypothetical protein